MIAYNSEQPPSQGRQSAIVFKRKALKAVHYFVGSVCRYFVSYPYFYQCLIMSTRSKGVVVVALPLKNSASRGKSYTSHFFNVMASGGLYSNIFTSTVHSP